jgi:D-alanyl-D-alanine carboxypeptidase
MRRGTAFSALPAIFASVLAHLCAPTPASAAGPAILFDSSDGKVLYAQDADNHWYPASLTKLMTAYLVFEDIKAGHLSLKQKISCSATAFAEPPSKIGLPVGGEITVDLALQALFVKSANDVAVMLAEAVAGSEPAFVERMNATAKRLGMSRTNFANPNGLPSADQVSTARDLARLSRAIVTQFPEHAHYWSMPHMRYGKRHLASHNPLLRSLEGADGLKTGFTCDSGFNIIASATRDGRQIVAVVLGDKTSNERTVRASSLLEYGFQQQNKSVTATLDSMPLTPTADGVKSVRADVESWSCNPQKRAKTKHHKHKPAKDAAKAPDKEAKAGTGKGSAGKSAQKSAAGAQASQPQGDEDEPANQSGEGDNESAGDSAPGSTGSVAPQSNAAPSAAFGFTTTTMESAQ